MQKLSSTYILRAVGWVIALFLLDGCVSTMSNRDDSPTGPMRGVLLDPGHGGQPGEGGSREECYGAISASGYMEKTANLAVARKIETLLQKQGIATAMTRTSDRYVSLDERSATALRSEYCDWIFVSIHFNRSMTKQKATNLKAKYAHPRGFEIYTVPSAGGSSTDGRSGYATINYTRSANRRLAECLESRLDAVPGLRSRGIKQAWFSVLRCSSMPGVLIEGGFLSNPEEGKLIESENYQWTLSRAIVAGISDYRARHSSLARN